MSKKKNVRIVNKLLIMDDKSKLELKPFIKKIIDCNKTKHYIYRKSAVKFLLDRRKAA